ncbi:MAG TPA: complex I subunit 1 family protein [Terriglobales bacterium]|nr:complex I subunit 1 family protein [Terriglobales bacterium]
MIDSFLSYLGSTVPPANAGNQLWVLIYVLIIFAAVSLTVMWLINWVERKALAHFQVRLGPMRVGPHGLLQPFADALKLMLKEDIIPDQADKAVFWFAPVIGLLAAFTVYIVIPFGPSQAVSDMNIGILFMLGVSSLGVLGIVTAGWASNSHYPLMGALRSSAQMVSYEVAMGLAVVSAILMTSLNPSGTGTLSMIGIVEAQQQQGIWFLFKFFPLGLIAFVIFAIAMVAETNRAPFDLPEAESELTAGFHTEYSGLRWSLFMLAEYAAMMAVSSIAVTMWLGGWLRPFPNLMHGPTWDFIFSLFPGLSFVAFAAFAFIGTVRMPKHSYFKIQTVGLGIFGLVLAFIALILLVISIGGYVAQAHATTGPSPTGLLKALATFNEGIGYVYWFLLKVTIFMYLFIWYRATWPRYRFDQLMKIGWKVMLPVSLGALIATAIVGVIVK